MQTLVTIALATTAILLYIYLKYFNYEYWKRRGIPSKKGKFPFGNVGEIFFLKKTMGQVYGQIYNEFPNEPVVGFYKMGKPILLIRDPDLIHNVLVKDFSSFHDNDFHFDYKNDPILAMNPFSIMGERWKEVRSVAAHALTPVKLKGMVPLIRVVCKDMLEYINDHLMVPLEGKWLAGHFTADTVASCAFGVQCNSFKNPEGEFRSMSSRVLNGEFLSNMAVLLSFYAPAIGSILKLRMIPKAVNVYFTEVVTNMVKYRKQNKVSRNDFLQQLMNDNSESERKGNGSLYTFTEMTGHCMNFYLDGFNTSAITTSFTLYELAMNPDCQSRARDEIFSLGRSIEDFDYQKLQEMTYMDNVLEETLRLHPPVPTMTRLCVKDTVLRVGDKKIQICAGTGVAIPSHGLHLDPQYYPEPDDFVPERFEESVRGTRHDYVYLPFGGGPRICIGIKLAMMQIKILLAAILMNYEILPNDPNKKIEVDPANSFLYSAKGGNWIKFKRLQV